MLHSDCGLDHRMPAILAALQYAWHIQSRSFPQHGFHPFLRNFDAPRGPFNGEGSLPMSMEIVPARESGRHRAPAVTKWRNVYGCPLFNVSSIRLDMSKLVPPCTGGYFFSVATCPPMISLARCV